MASTTMSPAKVTARPLLRSVLASAAWRSWPATSSSRYREITNSE